MSDNNPIFSLEKFEAHVHRREHEFAARELLSLLNFLDSNYGAWGEIGTRPSDDRTRDRADMHVITRTAAAISSLFADPDFKINIQGWGSFVFYHRWLTILFGASDFANADHVLHLMKNPESEAGRMTFDDAALIKFSLLYSGDSNIPLQAEAFWAKNPTFAAGLCMALLSSRLTITPQALEKKEHLLEWLPERLKEIELHDALLPYVHDVWMHCSYAFTEKKHDIKGALNTLFRKRLLATGCQEPELPEKRELKKKPTMIIPLEWFTSKHAMYRCFSPAVRALKNDFTIIAVATPVVIDDISREIFDEVIEIERGPVLQQVAQAVEKINDKQPDIIYYPSVGMQLMVVALTTLRLAPLQCMGLGHPATSQSDYIDYVITEKGNVGNPQCFHEKLYLLKNYSMPATPPENVTRIPADIRQKPDSIRIAITASVMKINPLFLKICQHINEQCNRNITFCFFIGHGIGISRHYSANAISRYLPNAIIYPHSNYDNYIRNLNTCDMFLSPTPFGNTNGNVDTVRQGLPGICMDGGEVHSHVDAEYFSRFGLPDWTIATTHGEYINAALQLVHDDELRIELSEKLLSTNIDDILFSGDTTPFLASMKYIYKHHDDMKASGKQLFDADDHL